MASREQFETRDGRGSESGGDASEHRVGTAQRDGVESRAADGAVVALDDESLAESDLTVTQADGWLSELTVRPCVDCSWAGFDHPPDEVGATLLVGVDGESWTDPVATELLPVADHPAGETTLTFEGTYDVVETTTLDANDFEPAPRAERPRTRTLTLRLVVDLLDEDGRPLAGDVAVP
ncbi:hypothetical protein, partial [Halomarina rubra]